jgi:Family of unknown function (DUF6982)
MQIGRAKKMGITVLVKYLDGKMIRGHSLDIGSKDTFHLTTENGESREIPIASLKAVFYLRKGGQSPSETQPRYGKKLLVRFMDGEEILGVSVDYREDKDQFFLFPLDMEDNNERILINNHAVKNIEQLGVTYGLEESAKKLKNLSRKNLEHEIYKLLYSVALEFKTPARQTDAAYIKDRTIFLKNRMNPIVGEFSRLYGEADCKDCLVAKLAEIRSMIGDPACDAVNEIVDRIV